MLYYVNARMQTLAILQVCSQFMCVFRDSRGNKIRMEYFMKTIRNRIDFL